VRRALRERHGVQTSVHYPPVHLFRAYRGDGAEVAPPAEASPPTGATPPADASLPLTEDAAARELTIPLFAHMGEEQLERVVRALEAEVGG